MKKNETVLITGGTSGFGLEFAKIFASNGYDLVLVARTKANLASVANDLQNEFDVNVFTISSDLTVKDEAKRIYHILKQEKIVIDILVNNAGIGNHGTFTDIPWEKEYALLELNIIALSQMCHVFIPDMIKRKKGKVLNIASLAAFQPGPYYATYFASKGYVLQFTEALIAEYREEPVTISALCPCPSPTDFFHKALMKQSSWMLRASFIDPARIAAEGYHGLMKGKSIIIPGIQNKFIARSYRILPRAVLTSITRQLVWLASKG